MKGGIILQEDIENRTITLMVNSSKFTGRTMLAAINKFLAHIKNHSQLNGGITHHGKQTVKQLIGKDQGVTSIELKDQHIQDFEQFSHQIHQLSIQTFLSCSLQPHKYPQFLLLSVV
jgi:hypothetical protein